MFHAHSLEDRPEADWQPLAEHLHGVADRAERSAAEFGAGPSGKLAGLLHDLGKCSAAFQRRIRGHGDRVDHATAGARTVIELAATVAGGKTSPEVFVAGIVAHAIADHHAGLPDSIGTAGALDDRLSRELAPLDPIWSDEIAPNVTGLWPRCIAQMGIPGDEMPRGVAPFTGAWIETCAYTPRCRVKTGREMRVNKPRCILLRSVIPAPSRLLEPRLLVCIECNWGFVLSIPD